MIESGLPGFDAVSWHGIVVPMGTPPVLVRRINLATNAALKTKEMVALFKNLGVQASFGSPQYFADYIKAEIPKWAKLVKDSGALAE